MLHLEQFVVVGIPILVPHTRGLQRGGDVVGIRVYVVTEWRGRYRRVGCE